MNNSYNGFYKVDVDGGGVEVGTFFNPETKEQFTKITYDIDNDRLLWDDKIQVLRFLTIDKEARIAWKHYNGFFVEGDKVEVVKGRKIPKGTKLEIFWLGEKLTYRAQQLRRNGCRWADEKETIAGCYDENGEKIWIKADYLKYIEA